MEDGTFTVNRNEDSNLLFGYIEQFLYQNYWRWVHTSKGLHVSNFIKERLDDKDFVFSATMLDKVYDITGYLCGARLYNLLHFNRLKSDYRFVFNEYYTHSRYPNGDIAVDDGLPATYLLFRQHSEGLYFARAGNFELIKIMQVIYMRCLTTDVLILFNSSDPIKLVHTLILNSLRVQEAFKKSCFMLTHCFEDGISLAEDKNAISYLFQFIVQGFIRVYTKDIYQLRLSNVLLSKTGASGIRTALLTLSADAQKKKASTTCVSEPRAITYSCSCGKKFLGKGWLARHILSCATYISTHSSMTNVAVVDNISVVLDNLLELECLQEMEDFDCDVDVQSGLNSEMNMEEKENNFDSNFVSNILCEDNS
jgi:hypothetical protein